jgi:hypothetical protein
MLPLRPLFLIQIVALQVELLEALEAWSDGQMQQAA